MSDQLNAVVDYALEPSELSAFRNLLLFQNTGISHRTLSQTDIGGFFAWIERLSGCYNGAVNTKHKAYYELVFTPLANMSQLPTMYQIFRYRRFVGDIYFDEYDCYFKDPWYSYWYMYRHGWYWREMAGDQDMRTLPGMGLPDGPPNWRSKAGDLLSAWGDNPPAASIKMGTEFNNYTPVHTFEDALLTAWTDFPTVTQKIAPLWEKMKTDAMALKESETLDNRCFFFLLHLLIGLGTGDEKMTTYVHRLTSARVSTDAYPEDTFINQLTYLVLMYLGDAREPDGKYNLNNSQLQAMFVELKNIIDPAKPGSNAILQSINLQLRLLSSIASYPLIDPETNIPLSERKASTRSALTRVFKTISFEANVRK
jgi:hypothetical protein